MTLTLGGLTAGTYEWTSFHHDTEHVHGPFAVWLSTDGGATFAQLADGLMTDGSAGGNPDSGATEGGPNAYLLPSTYRTSFAANGTDDVVVRFAPYSDIAVHRQIWGMNGFELERTVTTEASNPTPGNGVEDVPRDGTVLGWTPGQDADKSDVYLGKDFDDVNDTTVASDPAGVYKGRQDQATYPLGRLEWNTIYYWRIDSVEADGITIHKGVVWSFRAEPIGQPLAPEHIKVTASSEATDFEAVNTVNESGLDDTGELHSTVLEDMWLSSGGDQTPWIEYEFDKAYMLHQIVVWNHNSAIETTVGFGIKDATVAYSADGANWSTLDTEFARAPGEAGYEANTAVPLGGAAAKYVRISANSNWGGAAQSGLSEVRFLYIPVWARNPSPVPGSTNLPVDDVTLSWRAGRNAAQHELYLSTDRRAVVDGSALVDTLSQTTYDAVDIELAQTYYWKVNEVNGVTVWAGDVWEFSTREYLVVDNFERYNDDYENYNRVFQVWIDGAGYTQPEPGLPGNGSGALVGTDAAPWVERTIVHGGGQSMPLAYDNSATANSEATASIADLQIDGNWERAGIRTLSLWFYGDPNNAITEQMYVKVNGVKVVYDGDPANLQRTAWQEWNIDLSDFTGADIGSVTELTIGFERTDGAGGSGTVYIDNIRLYPARCLAALLKPDADLNSDCAVDFLDYAILAGQWLADGLIVTPQEPGTGSLVAHYEFEGNANDSAGSYDGITTGQPGYAQGVVGQAIDLDGVNDYVFVAGPLELQAYTMAVWFRSDGGTGNRDILSAYAPGVTHGILLELQAAGTLRYLHRCPLGSNAAEDNSNVYSTATYDDGLWHHAAIVKRATDIVLYVDGKNEGSVPADCVFGPTDALGLAIGILDNERTPDRLFVGPLDDVRVYDQALSHGEIASLAGRTDPFSESFDFDVDGSVGFTDISALANEWLDKTLWPGL